MIKADSLDGYVCALLPGPTVLLLRVQRQPSAYRHTFRAYIVLWVAMQSLRTEVQVLEVARERYETGSGQGMCGSAPEDT